MDFLWQAWSEPPSQELINLYKAQIIRLIGLTIKSVFIYTVTAYKTLAGSGDPARVCSISVIIIRQA